MRRIKFVAILIEGNRFGCWRHPEKSKMKDANINEAEAAFVDETEW